MKTRAIKIFLLLLILSLMTACSAYNFRNKQVTFKFKRAGLIEKNIKLDHVNLNYWQGGDGPPLLMIQGFGATAKFQWYDQVGPMGKHFSIVAPDLVYFGESTSDSGIFTLDLQVETMIKLMDALKIDKFDCMGISYGGLVAFKLANDYPDRVKKLIIVDSPGSAFTMEDYNRMLEVFDKKHISEIIVPESPKDIHRLMEIAYLKPPPLPDFACKDLYEKMFTNQVEEKVKLLEYMMDNSEEYISAEYHVPHKTLLVWGEFDPLFPLSVAERLKNMLGDNARLEVIKKTAHAPNMEKPKEFNRLVLDFLL